MELSWSTFLLEIVNFLILIWILKHFLYQPVLDIIARRRADIEKRLADARQLNGTAQELKSEFENRLADWGVEREKERDALARELNEERKRRLGEMQELLAQELSRVEQLLVRRVELPILVLLLQGHN